MTYKIRANCKSYSEWKVTEDGKLDWLTREFEGHDIISYIIIDDNDDTVAENESFEAIKAELEKLNTRP